MNYKVDPAYASQKNEVLGLLENFESTGTLMGKGDRNKIKLFELQGKDINVKSFKIPNAFNKIAYRFLRKSKAQRSFLYAQKLLGKGIETPHPVAYLEKNSSLAFLESFYVSEHLHYDITYRELVQQPEFPENEKILRAFTRFTFKMHEQQVEFLDHSPGNTLIKLNNGDYRFFLVDLNRMNFRKLDFKARMKNFSRLTPKKEMVEVMANEYAKLIDKPEAEVFDKMWFYTKKFQEKYFRKQAMKKKFKRRIKF